VTPKDDKTSEMIELLTRIDTRLQLLNDEISDIKDMLADDRKNMWKILALAIIGSFALVGVKLFLP